MRRSLLSVWFIASAVAVVPCFAQASDFNLDIHAHSHATARDIGLPVYPGATPFKEKDDDSSAADLALVLNSFHLSLQTMKLVTTDSPDQVLAFYRKPLAKYGQVLECNHGKPVGSLTVTSSGLTCGDHHNGDKTIQASDNDTELRAGTPDHFRIVDIENTAPGKTRFGLVALVLQKDEDGH